MATGVAIWSEVESWSGVGTVLFNMVVNPVNGKVYVSNRGGRRPGPNDTTAPSSGSKVVTDPVTGSSTSGTLSVVDAETLEKLDKLDERPILIAVAAYVGKTRLIDNTVLNRAKKDAAATKG